MVGIRLSHSVKVYQHRNIAYFLNDVYTCHRIMKAMDCWYHSDEASTDEILDYSLRRGNFIAGTMLAERNATLEPGVYSLGLEGAELCPPLLV